jgi:hypothetical protein
VGWFQPGGAGTAIYCYDDADATGGHAAGQPHTWAECNTAFPVDFPRMQSAAGAFYAGAPRQYLPAVLVTIGNPAVAGNTTTFVDTSDSSVYVSGARLAFTTANPASTSFTLGTKIGTGTRMTGKNGGAIYMSANLVFRGTVSLYGTTAHSTLNLQFINGSGTSMEIAGCSLQAGSGYVLGNSSGVALRVYNCNLASTTTGPIVTATFVTEGANNLLGCTAPGSFLQSSASNLLVGSMILSGAPTVADMRVNTAAPGWNLNNVSWSDTPGMPRFSHSGAVAVADAVREFWDFDTKVVDPNGNAMSGIPVYITNDIDGAILDAVTGPDGAVVFTWPPTGVANVLPVRDHYTDAGANPLQRDRLYLLEVNGFSGSTAPTQGYGTQFITFEWPGRDRFGTGYQTNGGSFTHVHDIIQLEYGHPTTGTHTPWIERVAP